MGKYRVVLAVAIASLAVLITGCGQEKVNIADTTRPIVISTTPVAGATGVVLNSSLTATFSKPMNPATITSSTFLLMAPGGASLTGAVSYDPTGSVATFVPSADLLAGQTYVATITTGAQDTATPANSLLANYVWTFTTSSPPPPPLVVSTVPANNATAVPLNQVLNATFNQAMDPATITTNTFALTGPGGTNVAGTVTYSAANNTASFTPTAALVAGTAYEATITTGARGTDGAALAANYVWTFQTVPSPPAPVVISTVPANNATAVPLNQVLSATFNESMNPATLTTNTFVLTGPGGKNITGAVTYSPANNTASFTPTAALVAGTAYEATLTTGAKGTNGIALAANYVWTFQTVQPPTPPLVISTVPANNATAVPLNQVLSATFNEAMNPATLTTNTFILTGPGGKNITGVVTYSPANDTASFTPNAALVAGTAYEATITTGAEAANGAAHAANYVWTFQTVPPPAPPVVISTIPANNATAVPLNQVVSATFSEAMNPATLTTSTFVLTGPGGANVAGAVTYSPGNDTASFTPTASLAPGSAYAATITTGAKGTNGAALAAKYVWTFQTVPPSAAPVVISTIPANNATAVPLKQVLSATFSEAMNPATLTTSTFVLSGPGGTNLAGTVTYSPANNTASFAPTASLVAGTAYEATLTTGAKAATGAALAANYVWTFQTVQPPPAPVVISTVPTNNATAVPVNQVVSATFSEAMNPATLTTSTFAVTGPGGTIVAGTVTYSPGNDTASFTPTAALTTATVYEATLTTGAKAANGVALAANYVWTFQTVMPPAAPAVISTDPANFAAAVPINQKITATFSEAMNPATISGSTFTLTAPGGVAVAGAVTYVAAGSIATFAPAAALAQTTTYVATITTGAKNLTGQGLVTNYVWSFTTTTTVDDTKPTVISTDPANEATAVPLNQAVSATFSKAMDPATITSTTFTLVGPGATAVAGTVTYAAISDTALFTPAVDLLPSTLYTGTITTGAADLASNMLAVNYVWTFTTGAIINNSPPMIVLESPVDGATDVPLTQTISATFSKAMNPLTITTATFQLETSGGTAVAATVSYDAVNFIATLTPSLPLAPTTSYSAFVTTGAMDLAGNALAAGTLPNPWSFTTGTVKITPPPLGTISTFGGFGGGAGMTNMGISTVVNGDIGTTGVSTVITGFHDNTPNCTYTETPLNIGLVNGEIYTAPPPPTVGCPNEGTAATQAIAMKAAADALIAYNFLAALPGGLNVATCPGCGGGNAGELGNRVLAPAIYTSAPGSFTITQGPLTLDAKGDANAVWVFQMGTSLTVGTPSGPESVLLVNGAQSKNVYWQVGSAAVINGIVGGGTMTGTVISQAGISVSTAGVEALTTVNGRLVVLTGPVTLVNTVINVPSP